MQPPDTIRFYFSFRSPYSWLALHRLDAALSNSGLPIEYIPVFPPPNYANDPTKVPAKAAYIQHDIARIAHAYGIAFKMPEVMDCEWVRPHAAYVHAADQGKGPAFARALYAARFGEGKDVGDDAVVAECAKQLGLDPVQTIAAQGDATLQERVVLGMMRGAQEDGIFGVPLFVFQGERYWGNDRIEWLLRAIDAARGKPVPDLQANLLSPVHMG